MHELPAEVRNLLLAAREMNQDRRDRRVLGGLAGRPPRFEYAHAPYSKEPLLWLADTVVSRTAKLLALGEDPQSGDWAAVVESVDCEAEC
ncbi:MAG: hypothetical protein JWN52_1707 [Actinomycetia bacterium]|nr:hypothetical protein [Actinomycetes bacterium]